MVKKSEKLISIKQTKSLIGCTKKQISCIKGLGLRKINHVVDLKDTPENRSSVLELAITPPVLANI